MRTKLVLLKGRVVGDGEVGWIGEGEDAHFPRIFALFIHLPLPTKRHSFIMGTW